MHERSAFARPGKRVMSLPPIDRRLLPADVRDGTPQRRKTYEAALGFERMLVAQLAKSMSQTAQPSDDSSADAATTTYREMLPDALADGIMAGGGLGLAAQLAPADQTKETAR